MGAGTYKLNATIAIMWAILSSFVIESQPQRLVARLRNLLRKLKVSLLISMTHYQRRLHLTLLQGNTTSHILRK